MFNRRQSLIAATVACLLVASGASVADPLYGFASAVNTFTAASAPSRVKPASSVSYTVTLTNDPASPDRAQRARIGIPQGFNVDATSVYATTTGVAGACDVSTWVADGKLIENSKIQLKSPGGAPTKLCPGATITVVFLATSAATEGGYAWATELLIDSATPPFTLSGSQPAVVVDGTPPQATVTEKPSNPSNVKSPSFAFTANEASTFECKLDTGAVEPCTSQKSYANLADGLHAFTVRPTDTAGNVGASVSYGWTIDTIAPTATITGKPSNPSKVKSPSFAFTANEASTFECKLDAGAVEPCTSQKSYADLAEGSHTFTVRATDTVGNVGASVSYGWTIDTIAPIATIAQKPSNPSNVKSPSFAFTANEASTFECKLDAGAVEPCSSEKSYANLADGLHAFTVRATDTAGNIGTSVSYGWTIDTIAPTTTITQKPSGSSSTSSPSFAFAASETGTSFACRLDNGSYSSCASPKIYSDLSDGPHTFAVRAIDAAGNTGPDIAYGWTIETRSPTAAVTLAPAALSNTRSAAFGFSADEPATFECKLDEQGFQPCSSPTGYQGLSDGPHVFAVRPRDAVGNIGAPASHTWVIDATAPETTISSAPKSGTATSATFAFSASEGGSFECRLDGAPFAVCGSPKSYSPLRPGDHRFEVRAVDAAGNADPTPALHAWKVDVAVAKVTSTALLSPTAGARVKRPPLLVWRRVAQAKYYNVQIYRGRVKVFTGWPTRTRLQLKTRWKLQGKVRKLTPGTYRWYVWPGYGSPATRRYGALLGQSTFVVTKR
jgi:hypothetical protein